MNGKMQYHSDHTNLQRFKGSRACSSAEEGSIAISNFPFIISNFIYE